MNTGYEIAAIEIKFEMINIAKKPLRTILLKELMEEMEEENNIRTKELSGINLSGINESLDKELNLIYSIYSRMKELC